MAEKLKYIYNAEFIHRLIPHCRAVYKKFPEEEFTAAVFFAGWDALELKQRMKHIAAVFHSLLPGQYPEQLTFMLKLTEHLLNSGIKPQGIEYAFITEFVELYGTAHQDISLNAMQSITRLMSCEFAIRPFLLQDTAGVMKMMSGLAQSPDENIRRFSSEGSRPRLPWGQGVPALKKDPSLILPVLEQLKNDPSLYVRKSVANNLNDISKDHPGVVLALAKRWKGTSAETDRILKHALRTLIKQGNKTALELFSLRQNIQFTLNEVSVNPGRINIGEDAQLSFKITVSGKKQTPLRIAYRVEYIKKSGGTSPKVFFITENEFEPNREYVFNKKISFVNRTVRTHYPGEHKITILVNGTEAGSVNLLLMKKQPEKLSGKHSKF